MALRIFADTRSPSVTDTLTVDGAAFDLTGHSVKFRMRAVGSDTLKVDSAATVVSAAAGTVRYDWAAADLDTPGDYIGWWSVTLGSGKVQDHPEFLIDVQQHAKPAAHLCEVADVREYLQKPGGDREQDSVIERLIARYSTAINRYCQREFAPAGAAGVSRTFRWDGGHFLDLSPYDIRAVTAVVVNPNLGSEQTSLASTDYMLEPVEAPDGVYQRIHFASTASLGSVATLDRFGFRQVQVTGTWGFASVPADVAYACVLAVSLAMRRDVQAFSTTFSIDEARLERPEALPSAVKGMLAPWVRWGPIA